MASAILNAIGRAGVVLAVAGATASQALYNGESMMQQQCETHRLIHMLLTV